MANDDPTVWLNSVAFKYGVRRFKQHETMSKETKTENAQGNGDLAVVSCCALLEELQLKLIAMSCFAQENFNEKAYDVTQMNIDEIRDWIKKKRLVYSK